MTTRRRRASTLRSGWPVWSLLLVTCAVVGCVVHAHYARLRRDAASARSVRIVRALGAPDLALSSTSRWLRHPSQAEPGAASQDGPAWLDTDPAGGLIRPPVGLYGPAMGSARAAGGASDAHEAGDPVGPSEPSGEGAEER